MGDPGSILGREDHLEKEMATHSSTLAWKIPWMKEPGMLQSCGRKELDTTERLHLPFSIIYNLLTVFIVCFSFVSM